MVPASKIFTNNPRRRQRVPGPPGCRCRAAPRAALRLLLPRSFPAPSPLSQRLWTRGSPSRGSNAARLRSSACGSRAARPGGRVGGVGCCPPQHAPSPPGFGALRAPSRGPRVPPGVSGRCSGCPGGGAAAPPEPPRRRPPPPSAGSPASAIKPLRISRQAPARPAATSVPKSPSSAGPAQGSISSSDISSSVTSGRPKVITNWESQILCPDGRGKRAQQQHQLLSTLPGNFEGGLCIKI
ncbi:atherin-like [Passer montanus]|uniref:atherin-like n=1 Tax=Passer montanus TaxID=9160 RepID=UPI001960DC0C|nr:atherin-like [Passer montanus]